MHTVDDIWQTNFFGCNCRLVAKAEDIVKRMIRHTISDVLHYEFIRSNGICIQT